MYVDTVVNGQFNVQAFTDSGCLCYSTVAERVADRLKLTTTPIPPIPLAQVVTSKRENATIITHIASFNVDIAGRAVRAIAYVIPGQDDDIILGLGWMRRHRVVVHPAGEKLVVGDWGDLEVSTYPRRRRGIWMAKCASAKTTTGLLRRGEGVEVMAVTLQAVQKALQRQKEEPESSETTKSKLPTWLHDLVGAFDKQAAKTLPPHRAGVDHEINLQRDEDGQEKTVPASPLYRRSREELLVMRKTIVDLMEQGLIRPSKSPLGAPVLFVKKSDGSLRFCVDYRKLNGVTEGDAYPLPLINETLRNMARHRWISKVDVVTAFHRIRVKDGDEWKTAFNTMTGSYEWLVMPFGLKGAPATFQRYINLVLREHLDDGVTAFIDDVGIYSDGTEEQHRQLVRKVVKRLWDAGLQLDVNKCEFLATKPKFLGYLVRPGVGLTMDPDKVRVIKEWQPPTTVKGVRGFLGFTGFYREFVQDYSGLATPLINLTRADTKFEWTRECDQAFRALKEAAMTAPTLAAWVPGRETLVEADSSGWAQGGALLQKGEDQLWHPVAYFSQKLKPHQCNYPIHDKEMLAVVSALTEWRAELRGHPFTVHTDHRNLVYFREKRLLNERQLRWAEDLLEYDCQLIHRPGRLLALSDPLSRRDQDMPTDGDERVEGRVHQLLEQGDNGRLTFSGAGMHVHDGDEHRRLSSNGLVRVGKLEGDWDQEGDAAPTAQAQISSPFADDELCRLWNEGLQVNKRYHSLRKLLLGGERTVPATWGLKISLSECAVDGQGRVTWKGRWWISAHEPLRTHMIQKLHDDPLGGHPGRENTRAQLAREYFWPGMGRDVRQFVRNCELCAGAKAWRDQKRGLLKPLPVPDRPWSELSVDFVTGLPPSDGCQDIMVVTDRLSKTVVFEPMQSTTAEATAKALVNGVFRHHGMPRSIVSDRGPQFVSGFWESVCRFLGIRRRLSTAFHPQTDGATERANQELEAYLRLFTTYAQDDWAALLPSAMLALNNRDNASTKLSPFFVTHGYHYDVIQTAEDAGEVQAAQPEDVRATQWTNKWADASLFAQSAMAEAQEMQAEQANKHRQAAEALRVGDRVMLSQRNIPTVRPSKKLDWLALPYTVKELVGTHTVKLDTPGGIHNVLHVDLIRRLPVDPLPSQRRKFDEPGALLVDGQEEHFVKDIVGHRRRGRGWQFLVRWVGYAEPTWKSFTELSDTEALDVYEASLGNRAPWTRETEREGIVTGHGPGLGAGAGPAPARRRGRPRKQPKGLGPTGEGAGQSEGAEGPANQGLGGYGESEDQ